MTIHVAVAVLKGGSGKTTTALSAAHALAMLGFRVLLADTDRQGQCATGLGMEARPDLSKWLGSAIFGAAAGLAGCIQQTRIVGLDLLSGNSETERAQKMLSDGEYAPDYLKRLVQADRGFDQYDFVVWDTPTYGILVKQVLTLADVVVMPVALALFGLEGVANFYAQAVATNPAARVVILPTRHKTRQKVSDQALDALAGHFGRDMVHIGAGDAAVEEEGGGDPSTRNPRFYDGQAWLVVPERTAIEQAQAEGLTIFEYAPENGAARAYGYLAEKIINSTGEVRTDGNEHGERVRANAYSEGR